MTTPFTGTEIGELESFIVEVDTGGVHRFSQSLNLLIEEIQSQEFEVKVLMRDENNLRSLTLQLRLEDFPDRREESDLDSSNSGLSHRLFEMTVALNEFGHKMNFDEIDDGKVLRVLRYGVFVFVGSSDEN